MRAQRSQGGASRNPCCAICRLAGRTAMRRAMRPQAAIGRTRETRSPMPPAVSAAPLMSTSGSGHGRYGGIIETYISGVRKWLQPAATKNAAASQRKIVWSTEHLRCRRRRLKGESGRTLASLQAWDQTSQPGSNEEKILLHHQALWHKVIRLHLKAS